MGLTWAARYNPWLLIELTPTGVLFPFLFSTWAWPQAGARDSQVELLLLWALSDLTITKLGHQHQLPRRYARCASADGLSGEGVQHAEVELLSWKKVTDITKDGGVVKKTLNESTDYKTATVESTVKVRCVSLAAFWGRYSTRQACRVLLALVAALPWCI